MYDSETSFNLYFAGFPALRKCHSCVKFKEGSSDVEYFYNLIQSKVCNRQRHAFPFHRDLFTCSYTVMQNE